MMTIQLAIHHRSGSFSDRWIEYCAQQGIGHECINGYATDVITRLSQFDALLWHFNHNDPMDLFMSRYVLTAAEQMGLVVFPDWDTCWHFDDKVAQKYLLEAIGAPLVPTHVFYRKDEALAWLEQAAYPLVSKLRRGAGSSNVRLIEDYQAACRYCRRAFGRGFSPAAGYFTDAATKVRKTRDWRHFVEKLGRMPRVIMQRSAAKRQMPRERGYVLFQDFVPGNVHDTRITVVGDRAWGFRRRVRPNDFRASGSGAIDYDPEGIDLECVRVAFEVAQKLKTQSIAFDFVGAAGGRPLIVEISYGYVPGAVYSAEGQWSPDLEWSEGHVWPQDVILENLLQKVSRRGGTGAHPDSRS